MQITKLETKNGLYIANGSEIPRGHWINELCEKYIEDGGEVTEWTAPVPSQREIILNELAEKKAKGKGISQEIEILIELEDFTDSEKEAIFDSLEKAEALLAKGRFNQAKKKIINGPFDDTFKQKLIYVFEEND